MTKRMRILALALTLVVSLIILAGCNFGGCQHEGGTATCTEQAVCTLCGEAYGDVLGHDVVEDAAVAATCTESGLKEGQHCTRCDYKVGGEVVEALGHDVVVDDAVPATCYSTGLTEGQHCGRCDHVIVAQTTTTMIPHTYDAEGFDKTCNAEGCTHTRTCAHDGEKTVVNGYAPTCTAAGLTDGEKCAICGEITVAQEAIDALGHDMADATCTAPASCKREGCLHTEGTELGHSYDEGVVTTDPTCEEKGVKTFTCTRGCGTSYVADVDPTGHDYEDTDVPSTCIAQGYTLHVCGNCGDEYKDNYQALADHKYVSVVTTEPTCEGKGLMTHTCSVEGCGKSYTTEIDATGHVEVQNDAQDPTCTANGWNAYVTCENCSYSTYSEIEATGHSGGKATCKAPAVCGTCGASYGTPDTVNGHSHDAADCDSPATCTLCGTSTGDKLGHTDEDKDHKCDRCETEMGAHEDTNSDHVCDYGCKEAIGICEDTDKDHKCDYGCGKEYGDHADADKDHECDYGCKEAIGEHKDGDADTDHNCDYCGEYVDGEVCVDENKNHKCDECYGAMGTHADSDDSDHLCDYCNGDVGEVCYGGTATCTAKAICSECGNEYGEKLAHTYDQAVANDDTRKTAATCTEKAVYYYSCSCGEVNKAEGAETFESGEVLGHKDTDLDHVCDNGCGVYQGKHEDTNSDHKCEYGCSVAIGNCADVTLVDHKCDYGCGATFGECVDANKDHKCDYGCSATFGGECADGDKDHLCDYCKEELSTCTPGDAVVENWKDATCEEDGSWDSVIYCTVCGKEYIRETNTLGAIGHDYEITYTWSDDYSTCTASGICLNDVSHVINETATVKTVTLNVTSTTVTYTYAVEFANSKFASQTEVVTGDVTLENSIATINAPAITDRVASHDYVKFGFHDTTATYEQVIYYSEIDVWDGESVSTSLSGSGTEDDPYLIQSGADLAYLANAVNKHNIEGTYEAVILSSKYPELYSYYVYQDVYFKMTKSIDVSAQPDFVIGYYISYYNLSGFAGIFDGNNCTIRGLAVNQEYGALFGALTYGTVKNLSVYGTAKHDSGSVAGVANYLLKSSTLDNVTNYVNVSSTGASNVGGLVGCLENSGGTIQNCVNYGTVVNDEGTNAAGIASAARATITNCVNWGDITGKTYVGGIFASSNKTATSVSYCKNYGTITGTSYNGVYGNSGSKGTITDCENYGTIAE